MYLKFKLYWAYKSTIYFEFFWGGGSNVEEAEFDLDDL